MSWVDLKTFNVIEDMYENILLKTIKRAHITDMLGYGVPNLCSGCIEGFGGGMIYMKLTSACRSGVVIVN